MGVPKLLTPEKMWDYFIAYKKWAKDNPYLWNDYKGKYPQSVYIERERPLTIEGFENYVADNGGPLDLDQYFSNREGRYEEFVGTVARIRRSVREHQIGGAGAGVFNPSIVARYLGLVDKSESKVTVEQPLFPDEDK